MGMIRLSEEENVNAKEKSTKNQVKKNYKS